MNDLSGKEDTFNAHKTAHSLATFRIYACMITPGRQAPVSAALPLTGLVLAGWCSRKGLLPRTATSPQVPWSRGHQRGLTLPGHTNKPRGPLHATHTEQEPAVGAVEGRAGCASGVERLALSRAGKGQINPIVWPQRRQQSSSGGQGTIPNTQH